MGCKWNNVNSEEKTEMIPEIITSRAIQSINNDEKEDEENEYMRRYADYPMKMFNLINKIRQNPKDFADVIEDSIQNIINEENNGENNNPRIIYRHRVKVALARGEPAFREVAKELRNMTPVPPLEFKEEICIPLPNNENDLRDPSFLRNKVGEILSKNIPINVFYKDLIKIPEVAVLLMIVDDNGKNSAKKRKALLNKNYKYIGISFRFIRKTFIAYYSFSK